MFEWSEAPAPLPRPPRGFLAKLKAFVVDVLTKEGEAQEAEAQANLAMGQAMSQAVGRVFTRHSDDAAGVVLDMICVGLSIGLIFTGIGFIGGVALAGGVILLGADSTAYAMEMAGNDEAAERFKKRTETVRIIATVATLPDMAFGGAKAIRELQEVRELRTLDRTTATSAQRVGARATNASRADRYTQIVERAHLRSQIRTQQINASLAHDITPRVSGLASTVLLLKEELENNQSLLQQFLQRLQIHCTAVHT